MVIDSHSHWLPEEIIMNAHFFSKAWGDIESQLAMMDKTGIDKAVLSYPTTDAHLKLGSISKVAHIYNDNLAKIIKGYPDKFIAALVLPIGNPQEMLDELTRSVEELGFRAISLASSYEGIYLDEAMFIPIYRKAEDLGLPIFVHPQIVNPIGFERVKDPLLTPVIEYVFDITISVGRFLMSDILKEFPKVKFIFSSFGGATAYLAQRFDVTYQMLRGINFVKDLKSLPTGYLRNIYVDTGGETNKINFQAALDLFGPSHILWGSDWPAKKDVTAGVQAVKNLDISEKDKENILGGNLARILALS
jgi:predicted TIM-barrel fold metal-dependent hydrolase